MAILNPAQMSAQLFAAATQAAVDARVEIQQSAQKIKDEAKRNVRASAPTHNAGAHNAITFETHSGGTRALAPWAEIGYDRAKRGAALGNLLEYGGGGDHSPPHRDLGRALDNEEPRFTAALTSIMDPLRRIR